MKFLLIISIFVFSLNSKAQNECSYYFALKEPNAKQAVDFEALPPAEKMLYALSARQKFIAYFDSVGKYLKEREYITNIIQVALIAKEHVLLMGPPGNAKSMISDVVMGNIKDENGNKSYYKIQMTPETTMSETHGPLDYVKLSQTSRYERLYEEGMLMSRNVFIDEIFDSRANALRNLLVLMNERAHAQGPRIIKGRIETIVAATNRYISEVYETAGNDGPKAVLDRFAFSVFVPADLELTQSAMDLVRSAKKQKISIPDLTFRDLDAIRALVSEVEVPDNVAKFLVHLRSKLKEETESLEQSSLQSYREKIRNGEDAKPPYRATKYQSPRTLNKAGGILKAIVVHEWLKSGGQRPLRATIDDVRKLEMFFTLNGPRPEFVESDLGKSVNAHEKVQLMAIKQEREIFDRHFDEINKEINATIYSYSIVQLQHDLEAASTPEQKDAVAKKLVDILVEVTEKKIIEERLTDLTGEQIGLETVETYVTQTLKDLLGDEYEGVVGRHLDQIAQAKKREEIEREARERARIEEERRQEAMRLAKEQEAQRLKELAAKKDKEAAESFENPLNFDVASHETLHLNSHVDSVPGESAIVGLSYSQNRVIKWDVATKKLDVIIQKGIHPELDVLFTASPTFFKAIDSERVLVGINKNYFLVNHNTKKIEFDFVLPGGVLEGASILAPDGKFLISIDKEKNRIITTNIYNGGRGRDVTISDPSIITSFVENKDLLYIDGDNLFLTSNMGQKVHMHSFYNMATRNYVHATVAQLEVVIRNGVLYTFQTENVAGHSKLKVRIKDLIKDTPVVEKEVLLGESDNFRRMTLRSTTVINGKYVLLSTRDSGVSIASLESGNIIAKNIFGVTGRVDAIQAYGNHLVITFRPPNSNTDMVHVVELKDKLLD